MQLNFLSTVARRAKVFFLIATLGGAVSGALAQDKITIRGSNTVGEELAPSLIAEYQKDHHNVTFDTEFKGSAYGIGALMGGYCDIAASSKPPLLAQEEIAQIRGVQFKEYIIGSYTVSVVVNAANPLANLSSNQVASLFTGAVKNWKEIGGADAPVHLYGRDPVSGTYLGFKELAMANMDYGTNIQFFTNYTGIAEAVAKDPAGVGYTGLEPALAGVKIVSINGVAPSAATINNRSYLYGRLLHLFTNAQKESPAASDFIQYILSPAGQQIVTQMGYAPKPATP
jgi:phosphate transport system substrate-binding protein